MTNNVISYNVPPWHGVRCSPSMSVCPCPCLHCLEKLWPSPVSCVGPFIKDGSKRVIWRIIPICPRLHAAQIPSIPCNPPPYKFYKLPPARNSLYSGTDYLGADMCVVLSLCFKCSSAPYLAGILRNSAVIWP